MPYNALHHWSKFQTNLTKFQWVTYVQNTAQKQPKLVLSAGMKTCEISKLENYESEINETWPIYVPLKHL